MGRSLPLGRIAGIRVGFSPSVLLIAALFTFSLAQGRFPADFPGLSTGAYWVAGVAGALLFFVSLLAHELAHAVVARREGVGVRGINLWLLGGVAELEDHAPNPGAELRIAVVGPVTSLLTGVFFLLLGWTIDLVGLPGLAGSVFAWLAVINVILAAFNILPAAPLDGGRVLSALIWMRTRNRSGAAVSAAQVGRALGVAIIAFGLWSLLVDNAGGGIWTLVVGWYITSAATAELRSAPLVHALEGMTLGDVMVSEPPIAPDWMTVGAFEQELPAGDRHRAFPVQAFDGHISGLLTAEQIGAVDPPTRGQLRVTELAFPIERVATGRASDDLLNALQQLRDRPTHHVLVVASDDRVLGVVGPAEVELALERRSSPPAPLTGGASRG